MRVPGFAQVTDRNNKLFYWAQSLQTSNTKLITNKTGCTDWVVMIDYKTLHYKYVKIKRYETVFKVPGLVHLCYTVTKFRTYVRGTISFPFCSF